MTAIYDKLAEAIRKSVPPNREIVLSPGDAGINSAVTTFVWGKIRGTQLAPIDYPGLLESINGELTECTDTKAVIKGQVDGRGYEIYLAIAP